jgi:hypothetical protein
MSITVHVGQLFNEILLNTIEGMHFLNNPELMNEFSKTLKFKRQKIHG